MGAQQSTSWLHDRTAESVRVWQLLAAAWQVPFKHCYARLGGGAGSLSQFCFTQSGASFSHKGGCAPLSFGEKSGPRGLSFC